MLAHFVLLAHSSACLSAAAGIDGTDDTILLQVHASKKPAMGDALPQLLSNMNMSNPEQMSVLLEDYVVSAVKSGATLDDATKAALSAMKSQLTDQSQKFMTDNFNADQNLLDAQFATLEACQTEYDSSTGEDDQSLEALYAKADTHKTCRTAQKEHDGVKNQKCDELMNFINNLAACPIPPQGRDGVEAFYSSVTAIAATKSTWEDLDAACTDAETAGEAEDVECDSSQEEYESDFCQVRLQMHQTCATYKTCHGSAATEIETSVEVLQQNEESRKIEWRSIERIKCYIDVLVSDDSNEDRTKALAACKDADSDTSHLDINYPELPAELDCDLSAVASPPCSPEFTAAYEGMMDVTACTPCADLPPHLQDPGTGGGGGGGDECPLVIAGTFWQCAVLKVDGKFHCLQRGNHDLPDIEASLESLDLSKVKQMVPHQYTVFPVMKDDTVGEELFRRRGWTAKKKPAVTAEFINGRTIRKVYNTHMTEERVCIHFTNNDLACQDTRLSKVVGHFSGQDVKTYAFSGYGSMACAILGDDTVDCCCDSRYFAPESLKGVKVKSIAGTPKDIWCVIKADGFLQCWGSNSHNLVQGAPTKGGVTSVVNYYDFHCATFSDGDFQCWGKAGYYDTYKVMETLKPLCTPEARLIPPPSGQAATIIQTCLSVGGDVHCAGYHTAPWSGVPADEKHHWTFTGVMKSPTGCY